MDDLARLLIERECGRLPLLFARYADNGDHASLAQLFTEDCEYARPFQPDHPFYGRDRVQATFRDRPPILVRHMVTNVLVEVVSETEARGHQLPRDALVPYLDRTAATSGRPLRGGFEDHYVRSPGGWRFKSRYGHVALHQGGDMPKIPPPSDEARGVK